MAAPKTTHTRQLTIERAASRDRTYAVTISTETPVRRRSYDGEYLEVLSHASGAIDLERAPLPLMERHDANTMPIGIVENLRVVDRKLKGEARFGESARAQEIEKDVAAGIVRNLSVGYSIEQVKQSRSNDTLTITATRWTPYEVSALAIGADPKAGFGRGAPTMDPEETETNPTPDANRAPAPELVTAERTRVQQIRTRARAAKLTDQQIDELIDSGVSPDKASERILDILIERAKAEDPPRGVLNVDATRGHFDGLHGRRSAITGRDRFVEERSKIADEVIGLRMGWRDLARMALSHAGVRIENGSPAKMLRRAMSTSDFPALLADVANKSIRKGYESEPASHLLWVPVKPVADFKEQHRPILGAAPDLERIEEGGEYKRGSLDEDSTSYRIHKFGKIIALLWEAIVNDDTRSFLDVASRMGAAALRKEADLVYGLFGENTGNGPTMQDSVVLFHSTHKNLTETGAFDAALLAAGRVLLRKQTGVGGGILSLQPHGLIVPAELEHAAELLLAAATRIVSQSQEASTPAWLTGLTLIVEPRLPDDAVFLTANPSQIDSCELGRLEENMNGPTIESKEEFERDEVRWKVRHVFGAKFLDWRGIVKMPVSSGGE